MATWRCFARGYRGDSSLYAIKAVNFGEVIAQLASFEEFCAKSRLVGWPVRESGARSPCGTAAKTLTDVLGRVWVERVSLRPSQRGRCPLGHDHQGEDRANRNVASLISRATSLPCHWLHARQVRAYSWETA